MITVGEVWELLRRDVSMCEAVETELADAVGGILREDVRAPEDQPAFDRSAVDGYVLRIDDASDKFRVTGEIRAGDGRHHELVLGQALRISTGAPVPEGGEVVMLEDAVVAGEIVRLAVRGRSHVRRRGEDARANDVLVRAGTLLGAGTIGLLASLGCIRPRVTRPLDILHVATGDEIVAAGERPAAGQVRDSNSPLVAAWARERGMRIRQKRVGEDADALRHAIEGRRDLLLISGGASVGRHDCTEEVLAAAGFEILVTQVAVRPGKPLIVARRGSEWAFGLPGNPLSHFACLQVFVDAACAAMRGGVGEPVVRRGVVRKAVKGNPRETWWPAVETADGLIPLDWTSSGDLTALATADALLRVPSSGLAEGEEAGFIRVR
jgi:molybdopterin molybdotransferase